MTFIEWNLEKVSEQKTLKDKLFAVGAVAAVKFACKYNEHTEGEKSVFEAKYSAFVEAGEVS